MRTSLATRTIAPSSLVLLLCLVAPLAVSQNPENALKSQPNTASQKPDAKVAADKKKQDDLKKAQAKAAATAAAKSKKDDAAITQKVEKDLNDSQAKINAVNGKAPLNPADALTAALDTHPVQGDYIPCKFSLAQLHTLILPDAATTLSAADAERLKESILSAAIASNTAPLKNNPEFVKFVRSVAKESFEGRTPGEALSLIIEKLNKHQIEGETPDAWKKRMKDLNQDVMIPSGLRAKPGEPYSHTVYAYFQENAKTLSPKPTDDQLKAMKQLDDEDQSNLSTTSSILTSARKSVAFTERPEDIGCSMSILGWKETSQAFGHLIANEYIAVQVVVRNLNREQQFLLHDMEFEVNADPTGRLGRFFSGRDKVIVRALSSSQSVTDPRGITVHTAQGIGHLLSAIAPFTLPGQAVTFAAAAMNTALVADLDRYWKDLTVDQGNLLNDVGFSSTANSQSVVPKSGTAMYVIFIESRPFEEGWWTQRCVETQYLGTTNAQGHIFNLARQDGDGMDDPHIVREKKPGSPVGIDVARALEVCMSGSLPVRSKHKWYTLGMTQTKDDKLIEMNAGLLDSTAAIRPCEADEKPNQATPAIDSKTQKPFPTSCTDPLKDLFRNAYRNPYHRWSPNSLAIFRELSNTVVSGMHITEDQQLLPVVTEIKCPKDNSGNVKLSATADLVCPVTGRNLDKLAKLRLRNDKLITDTVTAEGPLQVAGDSTAANLTLKVSDLHLLNGADYDVFGVSTNGVEQKTSQILHFDSTPILDSFTPPPDFSSTATVFIFQLTGAHLDSGTGVSLEAGGATLKGKLITNSGHDASGQILLSDANASGLPAGPVTVKLLNASGDTIATAATKPTYKPNAAAAPAAPAPADHSAAAAHAAAPAPAPPAP